MHGRRWLLGASLIAGAATLLLREKGALRLEREDGICHGRITQIARCVRMTAIVGGR